MCKKTNKLEYIFKLNGLILYFIKKDSTKLDVYLFKLILVTHLIFVFYTNFDITLRNEVTFITFLNQLKTEK